MWKALHEAPTSELWGVICRMASHSATCHLTQVKFLVIAETGRVNNKAQLSLTNPRDTVEIRVMGHSRASKVTPFDSLHMVSY